MGLNYERSDKKKITLSINKDVIEQAKEAKLNISAITESILKAFTFSNEKNTKEDVLNAYDVFFKSIQPYLAKYGFSIKVGYMPAEPPDFVSPGSIIVLYENSLKIEDQYGNASETTIKIVYQYLDSLRKILDNLFAGLITAAKENKQKIHEFELALRFFNSMSVEDESKS